MNQTPMVTVAEHLGKLAAKNQHIYDLDRLCQEAIALVERDGPDPKAFRIKCKLAAVQRRAYGRPDED